MSEANPSLPVVKRPLPADQCSLDKPCTILRRTLEQIPFATGSEEDKAVIVEGYNHKRIHSIARYAGFKVRVRRLVSGKIMIWKLPRNGTP